MSELNHTDLGEYWLAHHGIQGQKWGVQNGPPYPLEYDEHSAKEIRIMKKSEKAKAKSDKYEVKAGKALSRGKITKAGKYLVKSGKLSKKSDKLEKKSIKVREKEYDNKVKRAVNNTTFRMTKYEIKADVNAQLNDLLYNSSNQLYSDFIKESSFTPKQINDMYKERLYTEYRLLAETNDSFAKNYEKHNKYVDTIDKVRTNFSLSDFKKRQLEKDLLTYKYKGKEVDVDKLAKKYGKK